VIAAAMNVEDDRTAAYKTVFYIVLMLNATVYQYSEALPAVRALNTFFA